MTKPSGSFHIDRRANDLAETGSSGNPDDLITTRELCEWLRYSTQWAEGARHRGSGPAFIRLGNRVRYRRGDVIAWLRERTHRRTAEYTKQPTDKNGKVTRFRGKDGE